VQRYDLADADIFEVGTMNRVARWVGPLLRDERGGEVIEYALIAGLIVVAAIAIIGAVGTKVLARWTSVNDGL
jgi:Flp pilus assembly pilin Flp